jgi:hypothetical protein
MVPLLLSSRFQDKADIFSRVENWRSAPPTPGFKLPYSRLDQLEITIHTGIARCVEETGFILSGIASGHPFELPAFDDSHPKAQPYTMAEILRWKGVGHPTFDADKRMAALQLLERYGCLSELAYLDYLSRKVAQARTLQYFDEELAITFMYEAIPPREGWHYPVSTFGRWLAPFAAASDANFEGLMRGSPSPPANAAVA